MAGEAAPITGEIYHVFGRGVEKRSICDSVSDYERFLTATYFYRQVTPPDQLSYMLDHRPEDVDKWKAPFLVELLAYSVMPNHFHIIAKQLVDGGIPIFLSRLQDSYTKYFNTKYERVGSLLQGTYRRKLIDTEEYFLQVVRYVHLNGYVAKLSDSPFSYLWDSTHWYKKPRKDGPVSTDLLLGMLPPGEFQRFHEDYADYARSLESIKHLIID